jgi:hypothetical protein
MVAKFHEPTAAKKAPGTAAAMAALSAQLALG